MPTKNFYTANGMIIGESSGGTTTVYAPDGQGNVAVTSQTPPRTFGLDTVSM